MGEICMMIEEMAKVVRSLESQITNVKAINDSLMQTKLDSNYMQEFERIM